MTPCTVPSLASASTTAPATTCGCASHPVEEQAYVPFSILDQDAARESFHYEQVAYPMHLSFATGPALEGPPISLLAVLWLFVAVVVLRQQRRPVVLRLGLVGLPWPPAATRGLPRLVLGDGERRFLRGIVSLPGRFRFTERRSAPAYAVAYNQPRFRNQAIMPLATTMQTPQKMG